MPHFVRDCGVLLLFYSRKMGVLITVLKTMLIVCHNRLRVELRSDVVF